MISFPRPHYFTLILCLFSACTQQMPNSQAIRMGLAEAPENLDPRFATDATSVRINRLLYQRLVEFDDQSMPVPGIADWEIITPTHYRFSLHQPAARFSNGVSVTAADVVATYQFVLNPEHASPHRSALELIDQVKTTDQNTIDFFLKRADPLFPAYLVLDILPAALIASNHPFAAHPVGSGSFRLLEMPAPGRLLLERRRDKQTFELLEVKNPTVRVLKLLRGEIHLLQNDLSPELIDYLRHRPEVWLQQGPGSNFSYLGFNMQDPATGNLLVRQAIAHAINREAIIGQVMRQSARSAEALFPPEHWVGNSTLKPLIFSPERAATLLKQAGYTKEKPLHLVYKTSSDPFRIRLATIFQSQLKAVGIEVDLRSYDWGTFFGDIKAGRFQMYSLTWVGLRTPDIFRYIFATQSLPPKGANRGRYSNSQVDALLTGAEQTTSRTILAKNYQKIQQIVHDDLPYIPLWYEDQMLAARNEIKGYQLRPDGNYDGLNQIHFVGTKEVTDGSIPVAY